MKKTEMTKMLAIAMALGITGTQSGVVFAAESAQNASEKVVVSDQSVDQLEENTENETDEEYQLTHPWKEGHKKEYDDYIKQNEISPEEMQRLIDAGLIRVDLPADDASSSKQLQGPKTVKVYKKTSTTATVKWSAVKNADGYHVLVLKDGMYCWAGGVHEAGKATHYTIKGLEKEKAYEVQVVPYEKKDGKTTFGRGSKEISLNMKKQLAPTEFSVAKRLELKAGSKAKLGVTVKKGANRSYIKSVQYKVKNTKICSIKKGVVNAQKQGSTTVQTTVTLKNGLKKAFKTTINVKAEA